jgi:hypothetical protein
MCHAVDAATAECAAASVGDDDGADATTAVRARRVERLHDARTNSL